MCWHEKALDVRDEGKEDQRHHDANDPLFLNDEGGHPEINQEFFLDVFVDFFFFFFFSGEFTLVLFQMLKSSGIWNLEAARSVDCKFCMTNNLISCGNERKKNNKY